MPRLFTLSEQTSLRRKLRKQPTKAENFLWYQLRNKKLLGHKFRRQHSMGRFVLDFFCPQLMLAVEVDGVTHLAPTQQEYDRKRQKWIESHGVTVVRFTDTEILGDIEAALERLRQIAQLNDLSMRNSSSPNPSS